MVTGPAQSVTASSQVHLHHLSSAGRPARLFQAVAHPKEPAGAATAPVQRGRRRPGSSGWGSRRSGRTGGRRSGCSPGRRAEGGAALAAAAARLCAGNGAQHRASAQFPGSGLLPSDSATMMAKKRTAPLASLNQEQLNRNRMEDQVTLDDLWLTCRPGGGTGGPEGRPAGCQSQNPDLGAAWGSSPARTPPLGLQALNRCGKPCEAVTFDPSQRRRRVE